MRKNPILVTGCHRSGSTFVGRMLSIPRSVAYIHEPFNYTSGCKSIDKWFLYLREGIPCEKNFNELISDLLQMNASFKISSLHESRMSGTYGLTRVDVLRELIATPSASTLTRGFLKIAFTSKNAITYNVARCNPFRERLLLKDPIACLSSEYLHRNFGMDVVIIIRHPAAFVSSLRKMGWQSDFDFVINQPELIDDQDLNIQRIANTDNDTVKKGALVWTYIYQVLHRYIQRNSDIIPIKYEDLCIDPISNYEHLYRKLDIPWDDSVEKKIAASTRFKNQSNPTGRFSLRRGAFKSVKRNSRTLAKGWKKALDDDEILAIREITEPVASKFYADQDW